MVVIEPSILSADFTKLGDAVMEAEKAGVSAIQIDVMDGRFVPNINFGPGVVSAIRPITNMMLDVHLMIVEPEKYIEDFVKAGADRIIVHQEVCTHLHRVLQIIREMGIKSGVTLNPATPPDMIEDVLELSDFVQVMGVNPGFGGQKFIHSQLNKIRALKSVLDDRGLDVPIGLDGGIDTATAPLVVEAGATVLVAGSSVYNSRGSVKENVEALLKSV
ncbi:MAG: ribulose-phosphate 3-epimerase [Candidatus Dadabacteria bacterium]|nr:ribulose-phosphate 3-epimerase [Candidatus Dadabacteria bacterium]TDI92262.1 MAG: ribulose-phosphate 3-epimerase [Candidatus Dadabacteria bacterium]TDI99967.1 MAG: ribulose-phosphate 3-epimerase [Candidatus Dadabacteria bacterium]